MTMRKRLPKTPLTPEQSELVGRYLPFARKMARRRSIDQPGLFEFYHDAAVDGLINASRFFDPTKYKVFHPLAAVYIHYQFLHLERKLFRTGRNRVSFVPSFHDEPTLGEGEPTEDGPMDLTAILGPLSFLERDYVCRRFVEGLSQCECCRRMGFGKKRAWLMERRALETLRTSLAGCA
jgi:DNA-directed RNA polymerase specialized sigma subunit